MNNNNRGDNRRKIDTSRARQKGAEPRRTQGTSRTQNVQTSRAARGGTSARRKKNTGRNVLIAILMFFVVVAVSLGGLYWWVTSNVYSGEEGVLEDHIKTAPEFKGDVVNLLVLGIDYEDGRTQKMTDMIMYVNFDVANNSFNMLQIPRDLFVGDSLPTGKTGKINALYNNAEDKENPVNALATTINSHLKLPIDYYITIDMDSLKKIVDTFGGLEVFIPRDMEYKGSKLLQGLRTLNGDAAEFFVRCRYGEGFERADLDRLEMQRYFYSALFRRLRTMTVADCIKLIPHFVDYVNTDMPVDTCVALGLKLLKVPSSNILMARLPVFAAAEKYGSQSVVVGAPNETSELLNTYFRTYTTPIGADELNLADWPTVGEAVEPAIQYMGTIEAETETEE